MPVIEFKSARCCFVVSYYKSQSESMIKGSSTLPLPFIFYYHVICLLCYLCIYVAIQLYSCTTNIPGSTYILNTTNEVTMLKILLVGLERKERETYTFRFRTTITIKLLSNIVLESKNY